MNRPGDAVSLDPLYLPTLRAVANGEFTFDPNAINGYLHHGADPVYVVHSRIAYLYLEGCLAYDPAGGPILPSGKGEEALS